MLLAYKLGEEAIVGGIVKKINIKGNKKVE